MEYNGILHVAGAERLSRVEFALTMLGWWAVEERATLQLGVSDPLRWPRDCSLDIGRAQALLKTPLPGVEEVLAGQPRPRHYGRLPGA